MSPRQEERISRFQIDLEKLVQFFETVRSVLGYPLPFEVVELFYRRIKIDFFS